MLIIYYFFPFFIVFIVVWLLTGSKVFNFNYKSGIIRTVLGLACFSFPFGFISTHNNSMKELGDAYNWLLSLIYAGIFLAPIGFIELLGTTIKKIRAFKHE